MTDKIYKPKSCTECKVFDAKKQKCKCVPLERGESKAGRDLALQYKQCPLDWD